MKNEKILGDIIHIKTPYKPIAGSYARVKETGDDGSYVISQWFYCREVWHNEFLNVRLLFFSHRVGKIRAIAKFLSRVEDLLKVKSKTLCGPTQRKTIMWIRVSPFWVRGSMRRSLLTILMRVAHYYDPFKDNIKETIFKSNYTQSTKYAVDRFFKGHTRYTGKVRGWYNQFFLKKPTNEVIDQLLVKP